MFIGEDYAGENVRPLVSDDFNGDGRIDLVRTDEAGDRISLLLGTGHNNFADPIYFPAGHHPASIAAGDFNEDKRVDLAVINTGSHSVLLLLNNSTPGPLPPHLNAVAPPTPADPWERAVQAW